MTLVHRMAAVVAILLPVAGSLGGGGLAFTMYASSVWFRLEIVGRDGAGARRAIAPTALASRVSPSVAPFLAGSDHFRRTYDVTALRNHLVGVARIACATDDRAEAVEITLFERAGLDGEVRSRTEHATCAR